MTMPREETRTLIASVFCEAKLFKSSVRTMIYSASFKGFLKIVFKLLKFFDSFFLFV